MQKVKRKKALFGELISGIFGLVGSGAQNALVEKQIKAQKELLQKQENFQNNTNTLNTILQMNSNNSANEAIESLRSAAKFGKKIKVKKKKMAGGIDPFSLGLKVSGDFANAAIGAALGMDNLHRIGMQSDFVDLEAKSKAPHSITLI